MQLHNMDKLPLRIEIRLATVQREKVRDIEKSCVHFECRAQNNVFQGIHSQVSSINAPATDAKKVSRRTKYGFKFEQFKHLLDSPCQLVVLLQSANDSALPFVFA